MATHQRRISRQFQVKASRRCRYAGLSSAGKFGARQRSLTSALGIRLFLAHHIRPRIATSDSTSQTGDTVELGPSRRQLEETQGQDQGTMTQAHGRAARCDCRKRQPARWHAAGNLRNIKSGCREAREGVGGQLQSVIDSDGSFSCLNSRLNPGSISKWSDGGCKIRYTA